jgi:hypothetical protein
MLSRSGLVLRNLRPVCARKWNARGFSTEATQETVGSTEPVGRIIKGVDGRWYTVDEWNTLSSEEKAQQSGKSNAKSFRFFLKSAAVIFAAGYTYTFTKLKSDIEKNEGNIPSWVTEYPYVIQDDVQAAAQATKTDSIAVKAITLNDYAFSKLNGVIAVAGGGFLTVLRLLLRK